MNWTQFLAAKEKLLPYESPPMLFLDQVFDNGISSRQKPIGTERDNNHNALFDGHANQGRDFVWNGTKVRVATGFDAGGHPVLAQREAVYCAGKIMRDHFWFHSGHYKPKRINALYFFTDFVENTCRAIHGDTRDDKVEELCKMFLKLYAEHSTTAMYVITFEDEATLPEVAPVSKPSLSGHAKSAAIPIGGKSAPIPIGGKGPRISVEVKSPRIPVEVKSARIPIEQGLTTVEKSGSVLPSASTIQDLGITPTGLFFAGNKNWVPDSERIACALCNKKFNTGRRKHHCRQCGDIFCDDCSKGRKVVVRPAPGSPKNEKANEKVRVCYICLSLGQI
jgi:hypothetical protein